MKESVAERQLLVVMRVIAAWSLLGSDGWLNVLQHKWLVLNAPMGSI